MTTLKSPNRSKTIIFSLAFCFIVAMFAQVPVFAQTDQDAAEDLVVQAPDARVANWSTDPRSGTPGLPRLEPRRR